ncbi:MAG TPA: aminomethyltransferase family protein [Novimethylophilus sp.]|jgi:aminomethyltransferase|uniref:aminomethyltransferase family protein n=1 Tax=Novimethylophilus sp. TaxID=2137426 RepID=UPI002F42299E
MLRNSILNGRHRELGSKLDGDTWNGMPIPWSYHSDPHDEVVAVRSRAGLYDVSALNIINVSGTDAEGVLDRLVAVDVTKMLPGTSRLAAELDESGALCDDIMIIRDGKNDFRVSHGSGKTPQQLKKLAEGRNVSIESDQDVHILSLQGPKSLDVLAPHVGFKLADLPYFKHQKTTLFGCDAYVARGGYSGERGYEVYCAARDAVLLWDRILEVGAPFGAIAASWNSLDLTRVEAGLLFFPFEMPEGDTTPWEVNMGWGVDLDKQGDYIGKEAVLKLRGRERVKQAGLVCDSATAVETGAKLVRDGKEIGVVTSASFSRYLMLSIAMVHIKPEFSQIGTMVEVVGSKTCKARVTRTPFYDPMRLRTHPEGAR